MNIDNSINKILGKKTLGRDSKSKNVKEEGIILIDYHKEQGGYYTIVSMIKRNNKWHPTASARVKNLTEAKATAKRFKSYKPEIVFEVDIKD